jgi:hypothetical protein
MGSGADYKTCRFCKERVGVGMPHNCEGAEEYLLEGGEGPIFEEDFLPPWDCPNCNVFNR